MVKKTRQTIDDMQLDNALGDRIFCIVDLDLSESQLDKVSQGRTKRSRECEIEFVLSNPCFEIWLLYYFTEYPKVETSSRNVKEQLRKFVPYYAESYDVIGHYNLEDAYLVAMERASRRNADFDETLTAVRKNPYTEIPNLLELLLNIRN